MCDTSQHKWVRCPFDLRSSVSTFVRVLKTVFDPIKDFTESYVDDVAVYLGDVNRTDHSEEDYWRFHPADLRSFLQIILSSGITFNLKKTRLARSKIKLVGHVVGSGLRQADPDKVGAVENLRVPKSIKQASHVWPFRTF
jgi:hypothetical protein